MRECWVNVYPGGAPDAPPSLGLRCRTPEFANRAATGFKQVSPGELRAAGLIYRLHVRLKFSALPDSDALAAGKAGEGSHIQQEQTRV